MPPAELPRALIEGAVEVGTRAGTIPATSHATIRCCATQYILKLQIRLYPSS